MSKNIWDEEPFRDGAPEFTNGEWKEPETYAPVPESALKNFKMPPAAQQDEQDEEFDVEEYVEQASEEDEEEDFSNVLTDARLRLELGRLYEMVMNHSLFDGVEVDERASKIVQKQIRKFAKEQIELTLGMRQEQEAATNIVSSPFNPLEVRALKDIAAKLITSKGMKEEDYPEEPVETGPSQPPKKKNLNTIGSQQTRPTPTRLPSKGRDIVKPKPIAKKAEPIQRAPRAQEQPGRPPKELTGKALHEMNDAEKAEYLRGVNERNKAREQVRPQNTAPWPSFEEQMGIAHAQVSRAAGGNSGISALNGSLSRLVMNNIGKKS